MIQWLWRLIIPPFNIVQHVRWRELNVPKDGEFAVYLDALMNVPKHNYQTGE